MTNSTRIISHSYWYFYDTHSFEHTLTHLTHPILTAIDTHSINTNQHSHSFYTNQHSQLFNTNQEHSLI